MISTLASGEAFETAAEERDLDVLAHLHESQGSDVERVSQRSIARALGMSVGLTNAILKRLVEKGFVMVRRVNHNNAHYLVTPQGIQEIGTRSYSYLRRTIGHIVRYKELLRQFCRQQAVAGVRELVLVGESDLGFLLEWCASKEGLLFRSVAFDEPGLLQVTEGEKMILAETISDSEDSRVVLLHRLLLGAQ